MCFVQHCGLVAGAVLPGLCPRALTVPGLVAGRQEMWIFLVVMMQVGLMAGGRLCELGLAARWLECVLGGSGLVWCVLCLCAMCVCVLNRGYGVCMAWWQAGEVCRYWKGVISCLVAGRSDGCRGVHEAWWQVIVQGELAAIFP